MRREQTVMRTLPNTYTNPNRKLSELLGKGWVVVMVNPIGDQLEYILEREVGINEYRNV